jgi:predicted metal-dependent phosphoesterase TrpH
MPVGQPFTNLCQALCQPRAWGRADLHLHTIASDGLYTSGQIVELGRRTGLAALAITDHDTTAGLAEARAAAGSAIEVISGVEITCQWQGQELHLLGYFLEQDNEHLQRALSELRVARRERFCEMLKRLRRLGVQLEWDDKVELTSPTLGRRHLAKLLVEARRASTMQEAFQRFLSDHGPVTAPKRSLPVAEAITLVRNAGGIAAWAHPSYDCTRENLMALRDLGMQAIEVAFPGCRPGRGKALRALAAELDLAVSGGSDCHGPDEPRRAVGACSVTAEELDLLRMLSQRAANRLR